MTTRSRVPLAVGTSLSSTGAPSGTSVILVENSFVRPVTLARLIAVLAVSLPDLLSSKPNWGQSYLAAVAVVGPTLISPAIRTTIAKNRRAWFIATPSAL
jgi:hypothetical protein